MSEFISILLLFLDLNWNNIFDWGDIFVKTSGEYSISDNVYCSTWGVYKKCWYSSVENGDIPINYSDIKKEYEDEKVFYNMETFQKWFFPWRVLYVEVIEDKFLFKTDENSLNKNNVIYSLSNSDAAFWNEILSKTAILITILWLVFILWFFLFPKKIQQND